ncbi:hypothetical protein ACS3SW_10695 [Roseobacteraceae bacterium S113]
MPLRANVKNVFHNAETGQFEADVTIFQGGVAKTVQASIMAPISAEYDTIRPALIRAAQGQLHANKSTMTRKTMAKAMPNRTEEMLERILFAQPNYLEQILHRAA